MVDILVLGGTGFTGRLIVRYLYTHPQYRSSSFTFAIGARSKSRGEALKRSLGIEDDRVPVLQVDVTRYEEVEAAVLQAAVIISVVGPFWLRGEGIVRACAKHGKRYVDLSGEVQFVRRIIERYDYSATKTKAIIVPSCGLDSLPADIVVFLSNRTLKNALGPQAQLGLSESFYDIIVTPSGGTLSTVVSDLEETPAHLLSEGSSDYALSQTQGHPSPPTTLARRVPFSSPPQYGGHWLLAIGNRAIVQRTFGLNESMTFQAMDQKQKKETSALTYGPEFRYAEYKISHKSYIGTIMTSAAVMFFMALVALFPPARWLMKRFIPKPGQGPSDEVLAKGHITLTNYTECASSPGTWAKSVIRGKGDPGYLLTAAMISEAALGLLLDDASLPGAAHVGGVLTPATALGGVIVSRLEASGQLQFESQVIRGREESRKNQ